MLEELLKTVLLNVINNSKAGHLPNWTVIPEVKTEDIDDKVFGIRDLRGAEGSINCVPEDGEATYFNGDDVHRYVLRFIRYEDFENQFRTYKADGKIDGDWTKGWSRPDYMAYDLTEAKRCMIIHEVSGGEIRNKRQDGRTQLLKTVIALDKVPAIKSFLSQFNGRCYCYLSAKGCVEVTPDNMADSFMALYEKLPDPVPISSSSITKRGFQAFETRVVKL